MNKVDYLVVGSGLTGAIVANLLGAAKKNVAILERRDHIAGLCYDKRDTSSGYLYHVYGPHAFRTRSREIWDWLNSFDVFYTFKLSIKTKIDNEFYPWPPTKKIISDLCNGNTSPSFNGIPKNFEEASLSKMPNKIYSKFVKQYSEKQWGISADKLWVSLSGRFKVKENDEDDFLFDYPFQGLPTSGYTKLISKLLENIPIKLNYHFKYNRDKDLYNKKLIYTGSIDEFFEFKFGQLTYRGMLHKHKFYKNDSSKLHTAPIYNFPESSPQYIRSIDWSHWQPPHIVRNLANAFISYGYPVDPKTPIEYAYPILTEDNLRILEKYKSCVVNNPSLIFCGRLADYKYYDMNHAITRGITVARSILGKEYKGPIIKTEN